MDIIVVGAGVIGCACAHALAARGARVTVIDARQVGQGASQASAGVLAPYIEGHQSDELRALGRRSLDRYDDFIARVTKASGRTVQYDRSGTLEPSLDNEDAERHRATAAALARMGVDARWLDLEALTEVEPLAAAGARGALLVGIHGFVGVPDLTAALAAAAERAGATFRLDGRVRSIAPARDGRIEVAYEGGALTAERALLAAGSWSGQIQVAGAEAAPVTPVRGQLLHLAWPTAQPLRHVIWGPDCYIVPWRNGRVLVGATMEEAGFDERATAAGVRDLLDAACTLLPHLWQASFAEVRVGLRPASPDGLPLVGRSAVVPGLYYATGHFRNGVLLAPLTADLAVNMLLDAADDPALDVLTPARLGQL